MSQESHSPFLMSPSDICSNGVLFLTKQTEWYGRYSGYYEQLPKQIQKCGCKISAVQPRRNLGNRLIGKAWSVLRGLPARDQALTAAELRFRFRFERSHGIGHILNVEEHLPLLQQWKNAPRNLVATIHFPAGLVDEKAKESLRQLHSAIVLYRTDLEFYEQLIGKGRVQFVPHGVDTDFFVPADSRRTDDPPRILFIGQFYRDFALLRGVVERLIAIHPHLRFDFVIAPHAMDREDLTRLKSRPEISWHHRISDEALRTLYQKSALLLLPMLVSGANNAVVEALACGLPVVTNNVGGICDYGFGSIFPLVPAPTVEGMTGLVEDYLNHTALREETARACRRFAEETLAWPVVARRHLEIYRTLL
ncbi:MAG: glycosyltransferase family 4 protein [Verrucomicrobiota bacterium]